MGRSKGNHSSRRQFYQKKGSGGGDQHYQSSNSVQIGHYGFFVTYCASKESFVRNEIYNLLNRFADQLLGAEFADQQEEATKTVDPNDLDSALENEAKQLKETKSKVRRFQIVKSGTKHSFFVRTTIPLNSIHSLIESIFKTSLENKEQHSRYVERLLPVSFVCKAYEDDLRKLIIKPEFIEQILRFADESSPTILFDVQVKKSNNNQLKSSHLEEIVIQDLNSRKAEALQGKTCRRDYRKAQIQILLHVIKSLILISIVRHYETFKKYNLASINLVTATTQEEAKKINFNDDDDEEEEEDETDDQ